MQIQTIINNIFRQDFKNPFVLGRVLYGFAFFIWGLAIIFDATIISVNAPDYLPFAVALSVFFGIVYAVTGFFIFADIFTKRASRIIMFSLAVVILTVFLPTGKVISIMEFLALIGGGLMINVVTRNPKVEKIIEKEIDAEVAEAAKVAAEKAKEKEKEKLEKEKEKKKLEKEDMKEKESHT